MVRRSFMISEKLFGLLFHAIGVGHSRLTRVLLGLFIGVWSAQGLCAQQKEDVFQRESFAAQDAILVVDHNDKVLFDWQSGKPMIPASLTKLVTSYLAIEKWGLAHRFVTDFYLLGDALWVKGYGDPFIVSEEMDLIVEGLRKEGVFEVSAIHVDNQYFEIGKVPGRSQVADPYNAPMAAVSANFNTAMLRRRDGKIFSAEPQTPLTATAQSLAHSVVDKKTRVNLVDAARAQQHFAELLQLKAGWHGLDIHINQSVPKNAKLVYRHRNSRSLSEVVRGTLEYSNNFIANHLFLKLAESVDTSSVSFNMAARYAQSALSQQFGWQDFTVVDGSGLSRDNRFSAVQLVTVLKAMRVNKSLLKQYEIKGSPAIIHAKTGTLNNVQSYAGFIEYPDRHYRFVFMFNRPAEYGYREQLLKQLVLTLDQIP